MKKTKLFSVLTSLAVTGSLALSAMSFGVNAETNPVELEMVSAKTSFSLEEVQSGKAKTTIYIDVASELTEADEVTEIDFKLVPEKWGTVDPMNLEFCDPNQLGTPVNETSYVSFAFNGSSTVAISEWKNASKPTTDALGAPIAYQMLNFADSDKYTGPSDKFPAKAILFTDSSLGYMVTGLSDAGDHMAKFDVFLPEDLAAGTYDINFSEATTILGSVLDQTQRIVPITNAKGITITVTEEGGDDDFLLGDANLDKKVNVRDCATIAAALAKGAGDSLPARESDYNQDTKVNVRDAAAIAAALAKGEIK